MSEQRKVGDRKSSEQRSDGARHATERVEVAEAELVPPISRERGADHLNSISNAALGSSNANASIKRRSVERQGESNEESYESAQSDGLDELRKDSMMSHLIDSLEDGKDIGHYGRLVFAMVARHFLEHDDVLRYLTLDPDFSEEQAVLMLRQVEGRDYNPPRRERILEWQKEQDFPIMPKPDDPDCGNLYRNLKFPADVYEHIGHYQEEKLQAGE